jgi:hypothetical protein
VRRGATERRCLLALREVRHPDEELRDLSALSAEELTRTLADYFQAVGGLTGDSEREIARELVRRARRPEALERGYQLLLRG